MKTYHLPYYHDLQLDICETPEAAQKVIDGWVNDCEKGSEGANPANYSIKTETE